MKNQTLVLNKKRCTFIYKKRTYEIDELMDASGRSAGFGEYDIFEVSENMSDYVAHLSGEDNMEVDILIKKAKQQISEVNN